MTKQYHQQEIRIGDDYIFDPFSKNHKLNPLIVSGGLVSNTLSSFSLNWCWFFKEIRIPNFLFDVHKNPNNLIVNWINEIKEINLQ